MGELTLVLDEKGYHTYKYFYSSTNSYLSIQPNEVVPENVKFYGNYTQIFLRDILF